MEWAISDDGGSPITGYVLYMITVRTGAETIAYDGTNIPSVTSMQITGLTEGEYY